MDDGHILDESTMRENLRNARIARGLTQAEVADFLEISVTAYQKIEGGKTRLVNEHYLRCAELFGVSAAELVNGYEPKRESATLFADLKQSYGNKMNDLEKRYLAEIQRKDAEISQLRESIKDKDSLISTQSLLITQLMASKSKD